MKKLKKRIVIGIVMLSLMTMYGAYPAIPYAKAVESLVDISDTITDSDPGASATHTITFTTITPLVATDKLIFMLDEDDDDFSNILNANVTCPTNSTSTVSGNTITCEATAPIAAGAQTFVITDVVNPAAGMYRMNVYTTNNAENIIYDQAYPMVAIVDNVLMTARVTSTLNFTISGTTTSAVVNGVNCTVDTAASSTLLDFGTLEVGTSTTVCQELSVVTNADEGYTVVVYQDDELRSAQGSSINSFKDAADGTGTTTAQIWASPSGIIDQYDTYGHMGLTSDDPTLSTGDIFGATGDSSLYVGFNGYTSANAVEVMYHDGPADGNTIDKGKTLVAYTAEISALQEAGDYQTTITYVATPTY